VFATINVKTKEGFEIWMQAKILEGVATTTTLGDTLVEYQLLCFGSFVAKDLGVAGSIDSLCRISLASPLTPWTNIVHLVPTQSNTTKFSARSQCFIIEKGSLVHKLKNCRV